MNSSSPDQASHSVPRRAVYSLSDQVYSQIRADIICGDLEPGSRLVEMDLADQMGTSQGPIR